MPEQLIAEERLDSWKEIAEYLGKNERTAVRWEKERGLPIHRVPGGRRKAVFAYKNEIERWLNGNQEHLPDFSNVLNAEVQPEGDTETDFDHSSAFGRFLRRAVGNRFALAAVVCVLSVLVYPLHSKVFHPRFEFTRTVQLTNDGSIKLGLVTNGSVLYFSELRGGRTILASVPAQGGEQVRSIPTPFVKALPVDISADGDNLLVLVRNGEQAESELWIVPTAAQAVAKRAGSILCHFARWSPDASEIAYAKQNAIYIAGPSGENPRVVREFDAIPRHLQWSRDGSHLRVDLQDKTGDSSSLWEIALANSNQASSLIPLQVSFSNCCQGPTASDDAGRSFANGIGLGDNLLLIHPVGSRKTNVLSVLSPSVHAPHDLALDPRLKRIYAIGDSAVLRDGVGSDHADLLAYDPHSLGFTPFLPGTSATDVDFSRDGKSIAFLRKPHRTLWVGPPNGTEFRQIDLPMDQIELPRWSPDGKWVAFMGRLPNQPWRVYIVAATGGPVKEASVGTDSQGAPTWSPDGRSIIYGNVQCQETRSCAIHEIEVATGREVRLPGTEGLWTARWSPDGRFIAAIRPDTREVIVIDRISNRIHKVADQVDGNDLSWSRDSRFLYASKPAGKFPEIIRISISDKKIETAADLSKFARLAGRIDTWFALAPDGKLIFSHDVSETEIFALDYR